MAIYYKLDEEHNVIPLEGENAGLEWAKAFENTSRVVKQDTVGKYWVSTVFLGLDHRMSGLETGKPLIFETMVFSADRKESEFDIERWSTWDEAVAGHEAMVKKWKDK